jgi:predicted DsbA family dithiol-disulfide isomerase
MRRSVGEAGGTGTSLEVWGDYTCPFCYLGEAALRRVEGSLGVPVERRSFELRPPGVPLPDLEGGYYRPAFERGVVPWAERLGVEVRWNGTASRTRKAHEAAAHARAVDAFEAMHHALYRAYWVEGRDIGRIDVLVDIGAAVGLDALDLRVALDVDARTEEVREAGTAAAAAGVRAVPAYRLGSALLSGLHEPDTLRGWVADHATG